MKVTEASVREALNLIEQKGRSSAAKEMQSNADHLNMFVGLVNSSLAGLEGKPAAILGLIDKQATLAGVAGKHGNMKGLVVAGSVIQISTQTLSLLKLGTNATPGAVIAAVGAMFTKKVSLALGLVENNKQAKIMEVSADCAASLFGLGGAIATGVTTTAAGVAFSLTPVGWVLLGAALAQAGASAYQAYAAVQDDGG